MNGKNRKLALRLRLLWHEIKTVGVGFRCSCGRHFDYGADADVHAGTFNPNFCIPDGVHLLLTKMQEREDWREFLSEIIHMSCWTPDNWENSHVNLVNIFLDTTGKLRNAALAFLPPVGKEKDQIDEDKVPKEVKNAV